MATWSTDGELNTLDNLVQPIAPGTTSVSNKIDGAAPQGKLITKNAQIVVNDGTTDRVTMGQRADGTYGIKVSKSGYDSTTGTNDQMVMNSDFNQFKIVGSGTGIVNTTGLPDSLTTTNVAIAHGLGYTPSMLVFCNYPTAPAGQYFSAPHTVFIGEGTYWGIYAYFRANVDATYLTMTVGQMGSVTDGVWPFRYYLLQETAN